MIHVWLLLFQLSICSAAASDPEMRFPRTMPNHKRRLQSWIIRHKSQSKSARRVQSRLLKSKAAAASTAKSNVAKGSFLTLERPTKERLFEWFGVEGEDPVQVLRCMIHRMQYNHNKVGITNPLLHITGQDQSQPNTIHLENTKPYEEERRLLFHAHGPKSTRALPVSTIVSPVTNDDNSNDGDLTRSTPMEQSWWPELQVSPNSLHESVSSRRSRLFHRHHEDPKRGGNNDDWRVLVYRKRVGKGRACYERVRDAALDWEFESADGVMGLLEVPATCPKGLQPWNQKQKQQQQNNMPALYRSSSRYTVRPADLDQLVDSSSSSAFYRSLGASSRRLVSYSSKAVAGFLPKPLRKKLYAVNPVMVVYDVVDQRARDCTFTSTAYATLKGHWLSGEERVSVALRDGSQDVDVEILSISRAGPSLWGKAVWSMVGKMQQTFFQEHLKHLEDTAAAAPVTSLHPLRRPMSRKVDKSKHPLLRSRKRLFGGCQSPGNGSGSTLESFLGVDDMTLALDRGTGL
ncbi:DUF1990 domain containing protein [Nitzschia inconspicua]|uniref:DUF1990 domain containing protein n=1 Tax=Nitzschia inconspicua TaxID=303405 RepID=A0A9K3LR36_9STRA|nr:DUF1990 domain containing protein [Nitzschia inconspicua]